jgi:hypothetical protein
MKTRNWTLLKATVKCLKIIIAELAILQVEGKGTMYLWTPGQPGTKYRFIKMCEIVQRDLNNFVYLDNICKSLRITNKTNRVRIFFTNPQNRNEQVLKEAWRQVEATSDAYKKLVLAVIMES